MRVSITLRTNAIFLIEYFKIQTICIFLHCLNFKTFAEIINDHLEQSKVNMQEQTNFNTFSILKNLFEMNNVGMDLYD